MKKTVITLVGVVLAVLLVVAIAGIYKFNHLASLPGYDVDGNKSSTAKHASDHKNATYRIDNEPVTLIDGFAEITAAPDSTSKTTTRYFGNEVRTDVNDDGREDIVFLLTQESSGTGTFFYVVAALQTEDGWIGSHAMYLGDRIAPQTTELSSNPRHKNVVVINYAERAPDEPMTTSPSHGQSLYLKLDTESMQFGEVIADFEGEADPSRMTLDMKQWIWQNTLYTDDTTVTPQESGAFTLTFTTTGDVTGTTDCNSVHASYEVDGTQLVFGPLAATRMYCDGAQEHVFIEMLQQVQSYMFTSRGELVLELSGDSGSMIFQ